MRATILTAAYNKPRHLAEAGETVLAQTHQDWEWWIVLNGPTPEVVGVAEDFVFRDSRIQVFLEATDEDERRRIYWPSVIWNRYVPQMASDAVLWLSDDDLLAPACLETAAAWWDGTACIYWPAVVVREGKDRRLQFVRTLPRPEHAGLEFGPGAADPLGVLDGGQVLLPVPAAVAHGCCMPEARGKISGLVDGIVLQAMAARLPFFRCSDVPLLTHRCTALSLNKTGK